MSDFINTVDIIGDDALTDSMVNRSITEYHDNAIKELGSYALSGCKKLTNVKFLAVISIGNYAFSSCSALTTADFHAVKNISSYAFDACSELTALVLRNSEKVATLEDTYSLLGTAIKNGTGYIYVPRTMADGSDGVEAYKAATNWSTYANQFRALEDYTVDGTTTGELDPNKI